MEGTSVNSAVQTLVKLRRLSEAQRRGAALKRGTEIWVFWPAKVALKARVTMEAASHGSSSLPGVCSVPDKGRDSQGLSGYRIEWPPSLTQDPMPPYRASPTPNGLPGVALEARGFLFTSELGVRPLGLAPGVEG